MTQPKSTTTKPRTRKPRAASAIADTTPPPMANVIRGTVTDEQRVALVNTPWTLEQAREQIKQGYDIHAVSRRSGFAVEKIATATWS